MGDAAATTRSRDFETRLHEHRGILFKLAYAYGWGAEDREDLAQEIYRWLLLASPLLWALLVVVIPDAFIGFDVYRELGWGWVGSNLALGLAVLGVAIWLARRFPDSGLFHWLGEDLTGERLAEATASLDGLVSFAAEAASGE